MALNSRIRLRRSPSSSVVWVRSPVKTTKSGVAGSALTAATACRSVFAASGLGGPLKPQCESESWTKKKSSSGAPDLRRMFVQAPARPEAKTTPPRPNSCMNSRRPLDWVMSALLAGMTRSHRGLFPAAARQLDELLQLGLVEVGNRPVVHSVFYPAVRAVTAARDVLQRLVAGALARPDEEVHHVLRAPVDEGRRGRVLDVIESAAHQRIALAGPVRHRHGVVELS